MIVHDRIDDRIERRLSSSDSRQPVDAGSERRRDEGEVDRLE